MLASWLRKLDCQNDSSEMTYDALTFGYVCTPMLLPNALYLSKRAPRRHEQPVAPADHLLQEETARENADARLGHSTASRSRSWDRPAPPKPIVYACTSRVSFNVAWPPHANVELRPHESVLEAADVVRRQHLVRPLLVGERARGRLGEPERTEIAVLDVRAIESDREAVGHPGERRVVGGAAEDDTVDPGVELILKYLGDRVDVRAAVVVAVAAEGIQGEARRVVSRRRIADVVPRCSCCSSRR